MTLSFGTVCSGIGAPEAAWTPLGWAAKFASEIEAFPRAVLAHRHPGVPVHGDFTTIKETDYDAIDVLCGGTPCQSFSVAGLRGGMADARGNLALEYIRLADRLRPQWVVWENVPGVLSSHGGRDFGSFLGALGDIGYGFAYRMLDAQYFGLAQRRKRVFVVGCLGDWRRAAAVLFEPASLRGHPAPRREAGAVPAALTANGVGTCGADDNQAQAGHLIAAFGGNNQSGPIDVATACNAHGGPMGRLDFESETFVTHSLRADGFDASEDGTGRGTPLVPVAYRTSPNCGAWDTGDRVDALTTGTDPCSHILAFSSQERAVSENLENGTGGKGWQEGIGYTLEARNKVQACATASAVRRLTPRECERLQGFPEKTTEGFTAIPYRNKPAADGPRYKAIGNSMAVPVMRWIGRRIEGQHREMFPEGSLEQRLRALDQAALNTVRALDR